MPAVAADVLIEPAARRDPFDAVPLKAADQRMAYVRQRVVRLQKAMSARARRLLLAGAMRDVMHVMAEQTAAIPDLLGECAAREEIAGGPKQQRVAAAHADVLAMSVTFGEQVVRMDPQETGEGVPHPRDGAALQNRRLASRALMPGFEERAVADAMTEETAAQPVERSGVAGAVELERSGVTHIL